MSFCTKHFSLFARNISYNPKYESERNRIQVKWDNICHDIIEVMTTYRNGRTFPN